LLGALPFSFVLGLFALLFVPRLKLEIVKLVPPAPKFPPAMFAPNEDDEEEEEEEAAPNINGDCCCTGGRPKFELKPPPIPPSPPPAAPRKEELPAELPAMPGAIPGANGAGACE